MTLRTSDPEVFDSSKKWCVSERFWVKQCFRACSCLTVVYDVVGNGEGERQGARYASHIGKEGLG